MQRFFLPSHPRQRGLPTLRIFVIGAPPNWGGPGIPHRAMTSSRSPSLTFMSAAMAVSDHPCPCSEIISRMASRLKRQQFAIVAAPEAEGHRPPEEPAAGVLVGLDLRDALVDAIALGSANAAAIVRNCLLIPLPAMSPPKSNRCSLTPRLEALDDLGYGRDRRRFGHQHRHRTRFDGRDYILGLRPAPCAPPLAPFFD
jgi:hypothetical protein